MLDPQQPAPSQDAVPQPGELDWELGKTANLPSRGVEGLDNLLAGSSPERQTNVEVVVSAFRTLLTSIAYVSMPIASGKRLYDTLDKYGVKTKQELNAIDPGIMGREVIGPNADDGNRFSEAVMKRAGYPVLVPGIFESKGQRWEENEYMALWLRVLEGKAKEIHLIQSWEYSNGGVEEFVRGSEIRAGLSRIEENSDLDLFDHEGNSISLNRGARLIAEALIDLRARGFEAPRLEVALRKLEEVGQLWASGIPQGHPEADFDHAELRQLRDIAENR